MGKIAGSIKDYNGFCITRAMGFLFDNNETRIYSDELIKIYPYCFKLYDDDGNLYFVGYSDDDSSFAPLDDYGIDYGCTEIKYYNKTTKTWDTL